MGAIALTVLTVVMMMISTVSASSIDFSSPQEGDILTQKAVPITGTATPGSSMHVEDSYEDFDMGGKVNLSLLEDGSMTLSPYIGKWMKGNSNPVVGVGGAGDFNETGSTASSAMLDGSVYKIWGAGVDGAGNWALGLWTSNNGNSWSGSGSNPILTPGGSSTDFDHNGVMSPSVIKDGSTYKMWYSGKGNDDRWRIGYATSADGVSWTKANGGDPVLDLGIISKFDGGGVAHPSVIKDGSTYKMWYAGVIEGTNYWQIGYATSTDGINWTRQNNNKPVIGFGGRNDFDENGANFHSVVKDGGSYHIWYVGLPTKDIGYASSDNGVMWTKDTGNPIITKGAAGSFDENAISNLGVIKDGLEFKMWFTGTSVGERSIGYADADIEGLTGIYTSKPYDAGYSVTWGKVWWNCSNPGSTSSMVETRTSPDSSDWTDWAEVANQTETPSDPGKYFQYKLTMDTTDNNILPTFYNLSVLYRQVIKVEVSLDNVSWFVANGTDEWDINMTLKEGNNTIYVKMTDTTLYPTYSHIRVRVDTTLPEGHVEINGGDTFTTTETVTLTVNADDIMGVDKMRFGNQENLTGVEWEDYGTTKVWCLDTGGGDGAKSVYVEFMDSNGLISRTYSDTIILDTTPPEASIEINDNTTYAAVTEVQLKLKASDKNGVKRMRVSNNESFEGAVWDDYLTTLSHEIQAGDGLKKVYAEFEDIAGLTTVVSDTITLDTSKPTGSIIINNDTELTNGRMVQLSLEAYDENGVEDMMISNYPDLVDGVWEDFSASKSWEIPNNIGDNHVYARFRDAAGLVSDTYSDSIFLHTMEITGSVDINENQEITADPLVDLTIDLKGNQDDIKMIISTDEGFSGASWRPYKEAVQYNISPDQDGEHTIYVKFKDKWDIESDTFSDSIIIDTTDPEISIHMPTEGQKLKNDTLFITGSSSDNIGLKKVEISVDNGPWIQMQDMENWTHKEILTLRGTHNVRARATDTVGNSMETSVSFTWPKKKKTEPGFEAIVLLGAIGLLILLQRRRELS